MRKKPICNTLFTVYKEVNGNFIIHRENVTIQQSNRMLDYLDKKGIAAYAKPQPDPTTPTAGQEVREMRQRM